MTIKELKEHSDKRDDGIENKIDEINDFMRNGLSTKIIQGITNYLDQQTAKRVRLFAKMFIGAVVLSLVGGAISLLLA